jgi:hypothetical protein
VVAQVITADRYFGLMSHKENPTLEVMDNAAILLKRVNGLLEELLPTNISAVLVPVINSGWRTAAYNATVPNAAPRSKHISGQAIDLADPKEELDSYLTDEILERHELWRESPIATKGWVHLQSIPPRSGNRTFLP